MNIHTQSLLLNNTELHSSNHYNSPIETFSRRSRSFPGQLTQWWLWGVTCCRELMPMPSTVPSYPLPAREPSWPTRTGRLSTFYTESVFNNGVASRIIFTPRSPLHVVCVYTWGISIHGVNIMYSWTWKFHFNTCIKRQSNSCIT